MARLIFTLLLSMLISCQPSSEKTKTSLSTGQVATVALSSPPIASPDNSLDTSILHRTFMPDPMPDAGKRVKKILLHSTSVKVSDDGDVVAIWTEAFEPIDREDGDETRYLLGKHVDQNDEFFRLVLSYYPSSSEDEYCPPPPKWHKCSALALQERRQKENRFLSAHQWTELEYFIMDLKYRDRKRFQKLLFPNLYIYFEEMTLRLQKPSGEILLAKEIPRWPVYIKPTRLADPNEYSIAFIGIEVSLRTIVVALHSPDATDFNFKFHTFRLPSF